MLGVDCRVDQVFAEEEAMKLKLCVVISDANQAAHTGGGVEVRTQAFELPAGALSMIQEVYGSPYMSVTLGIQEDHEAA